MDSFLLIKIYILVWNQAIFSVRIYLNRKTCMVLSWNTYNIEQKM